MLRTPPSPEIIEVVSFDGAVSETSPLIRPDRYWMIESSEASSPRIARGGGYSYAAASFGAGSLVMDMRRFNRALDFEGKCVQVEAGMTLGELCKITGPRGLLLGVQPGYPDITIGGCIAANAHGKNPHADGTFAGLVESLTLFHPRHGVIEADRARNAEAFELTIGGYGLTGIILSAKLKLAPVAGWTASVERIEVAGPMEALALLTELTDGSAFAYTWHDAVPRPSTFGRGFVYRGTIKKGGAFSASVLSHRPLDAWSRRRLPGSLMGCGGARLLTRGFWFTERAKPARLSVPLLDAMFPFARRREYFLLYGRRGFAEFQAIVPLDAAREFLAELSSRLLSDRAPGVMLSMKLFRGSQQLLRFEGNGVCVTLNLARKAKTAGFLAKLDGLCRESGAIPNIIKDSRLPRAVVQSCYPDYEEFRERLRAFDPDRSFRSELSEGLGL